MKLHRLRYSKRVIVVHIQPIALSDISTHPPQYDKPYPNSGIKFAAGTAINATIQHHSPVCTNLCPGGSDYHVRSRKDALEPDQSIPRIILYCWIGTQFDMP